MVTKNLFLNIYGWSNGYTVFHGLQDVNVLLSTFTFNLPYLFFIQRDTSKKHVPSMHRSRKTVYGDWLKSFLLLGMRVEVSPICANEGM